MMFATTECHTVGEIAEGLPKMALSTTHTVQQAVEMMDHFNRYAVAVESGGMFAGLFTYNDYLSEVLLRTRHPAHTLLEDVMTLEPLTLPPECSVEEAQEACHLGGSRYFPVVDHGKLRAVMSVSDLTGGRHRQYEMLNPPLRPFASTQPFTVFPV